MNEAASDATSDLQGKDSLSKGVKTDDGAQK